MTRRSDLRCVATAILLCAALSGVWQFLGGREEVPTPVDVGDRRMHVVRAAIMHAWQGYADHAWGADELKPLARAGNSFSDCGLTIVEAMSTLLLAKLPREFRKAREWVLAHDLSSCAERAVGSLLSAAALQGGDEKLVGLAAALSANASALELTELSRVTYGLFDAHPPASACGLLVRHALQTRDAATLAAGRHCASTMVRRRVRCTTAGLPMLALGNVSVLRHQSCAVPAMLLQADTEHELAAGLLEGCLALHASKSRVGADSARMALASDRRGCLGSGSYTRTSNADVLALVEPSGHHSEVFESLFYFWRRTRDERYRTIAWNLFRAIEDNQRVVSGGFTVSLKYDIQESAFIARTLKFLFLTFAPDSTLDLDAWAMNTYAQPLPVRD